MILRGTQDDLLPVFFNGVQLSEIYLNGVKATGLIRDGVRVFARRMKAQLRKQGANDDGTAQNKHWLNWRESRWAARELTQG